jgi:uncharacterized protein (TIGR04141 family)
MAKSRGFSIYLLKDAFNAQNSLKDEHGLELVSEENTNLPEGAIMYIADRPSNEPWWKDYWGISKNLFQVQKGALVFLPVENRWMVLTFGMTYHQLIENCYEYDFGLRSTLNTLDPEKIKSTDVLEPESAKRERIQSPTASNLTFFDIKQDESIVKKLTGAVRLEFQDILTNITGASSLRITSKLKPNEITGLCENLLDIYNRLDYLETFPDIQNILPLKDPDKLLELNQQLIIAFNDAPRELVLSIPEIIDHTNSFVIKYGGVGRSGLEFNDVFIGDYRQYLETLEVERIDNIQDFQKHQMIITDENGIKIHKFSIYKCFLFDCELNGNNYHLCEGEWYQIENNYIEKLKNSLDPYFTESHDFLTVCNHVREDSYNQAISSSNSKVICLDKMNISPDGQSQIEPCDLISKKANTLEFVHVKISTRSSSLSHLFNQGYNSMAILRMELESRTKLKNLLGNDMSYNTFIDENKFLVVYGIITKKDASKKSMNLPIFSRISLLRVLNGFKLMNIPCLIYFIPDNVDR